MTCQNRFLKLRLFKVSCKCKLLVERPPAADDITLIMLYSITLQHCSTYHQNRKTGTNEDVININFWESRCHTSFHDSQAAKHFKFISFSLDLSFNILYVMMLQPSILVCYKPICNILSNYIYLKLKLSAKSIKICIFVKLVCV